MKPNPGLDVLCERAVAKGVFGTKMRSVINLANPAGIKAIVAQQFEIGAQVAKHGLVPILEPEVLIKSPDKKAAEQILHDAVKAELEMLPAEARIMLKVTIPEVPDSAVAAELRT